MDKKEIINTFVNTKNSEDDMNFNLVFNKLNDFLSPFFEKLVEENKNNINFKINLIGDKFLKSNYDFVDSATIMIEYQLLTDETSYDFSEKLNNQTQIRRLLTESFHPKSTIVPTIDELVLGLYNHLCLNTKDISIFKRKNGISVRLFGFKFFIFFALKSPNERKFNFQIKGTNYQFNFNLMHENLLNLNEKTHEKFFNLVKFYKIIERELNLLNFRCLNASKKLYFYENLLYSLPEKTFESDYVFDNFIESYNYLLNIYKYDDFDDLKNAENKPLFVENEYELFAKYYVTKHDLKLVLKQCKVFIENIDSILKA